MNRQRQDPNDQPIDVLEGTAGVHREDAPSAGEVAQRIGERPAPGDAIAGTPGDRDKTATRLLPAMTDAELRRLVILEPGTPLEQGSTYVDLADVGLGPFTAMGGEVAGPGSRLVAKRETDYRLWNRLVGQWVDPEREAGEAPG
ncbi:MAG TPA: hypothetical protein VFI22_17045 [Thermomicrobiales bacterium]|nr:hypothetical protein [Thermomicrobiales bacterium]